MKLRKFSNVKTIYSLNSIIANISFYQKADDKPNFCKISKHVIPILYDIDNSNNSVDPDKAAHDET